MSAWEDYVDVDFAPIIEDAADPRMGGCDLRPDEPGENHELFGSRFAAIPRREWEEQSEIETAKALCIDDNWSQAHEGSCTAFNTAMNYMVCFNRTFGKHQRILVSPQSTFKKCGRSHRGGSSISCNMKHARQTGYLPQDTPEMKTWMQAQGLNDRHVLPAVGFYTRYPQDWEQTAQHFRFAETFDVGNFDEFASALQLGFTVSYGRAGHSICAVALVRYKGKWAVLYRNSWGNRWGRDGYGIDTERAIAPSIRSYGAIATRTIVIPDLPFVTAG